MSKSSRRARSGNRPTGSRPSGNRPTGTSPTANPIANDAERNEPPTAPNPQRPDHASTRAAGTRTGRRERARPVAQKPFFERYRPAIVAVVGVAAIALMGIWAFNSASAAAYTCSVEFEAAPTASPGPDATAEPGYVQEYMGNGHVSPGAEVTYTYCPPASGSHYNAPPRGPIPYRLYGPNDDAIPQGWVHNLEHGALVILYRGQEGDPGLTTETQDAIRTFAEGLPPSPVCGRSTDQFLVAARFDEMATPFAALVWGRILPLQTFDTEAFERFWNTNGEQELTMPERLGCPAPSTTPDASPSPS